VERRSYDLLAEGVVVDRIMKAAAALVEAPRLWTLIFGSRGPQRRRSAKREAAMVAFAKSWRE
jgi:hypothetical protein